MATKAAEKAREILESYLTSCGHSPENVKKWLDEIEAATIERCAQIADAERVDSYSTNAAIDVAYNRAIRDVAAAIRSMGEQK